MKAQDAANYNRIASAIHYISEHFKNQPGLDDIAASVHMSPFHFQRMFTEWAGVSPKKFVQYLSVEHAKTMLRAQQASVFDAALDAGLSGTGRLHDLFVSIEGMTPGEYKNGGAALDIRYGWADSLFGPVLVAATTKGICHMAFADDPVLALQALHAAFPQATFTEASTPIQQHAIQLLTGDRSSMQQLKLHLRGTDFQLKVWQSLLRIPAGALATYGSIAQSIDSPGASRAVGTAVGDNPVAFLIPCHRVIRANGALGQYHWGSTRKMAMIGWEAAMADEQKMAG
jgi:AraC family transcriptional regulator of adaptative response/methylated-DNA-[protein]-cysteine methyltransferase